MAEERISIYFILWYVKMKKLEIEFSYSQMIDYRMQKDFYEKFGKKRRLKIAIYYVLITLFY